MSRQTRDTLIGMKAWQPLTSLTLGPSPVLVQRPFDTTNCFYRGA